MPHAALCVVQLQRGARRHMDNAFQCRTRLCGWCNFAENWEQAETKLFQCRTRLCGWCNRKDLNVILPIGVSFNAARGFVGGATSQI